MSTDPPSEIRVRDRTGTLIVSFADGRRYELPFEYLRVFSPSAEVQGHGPGQQVLVTGKEKVGIRAVEPIGQYAVRLIFSGSTARQHHGCGWCVSIRARQLPVQ